MLTAQDDLIDRQPVWDAMQMVWMDTSVKHEMPNIISVSGRSKYSIEELEFIYWNEVRPVVCKNFLWIIAPEWAGYETGLLTDQILKKSDITKTSKKAIWKFYSFPYWLKIRKGVLKAREHKT